jgi:hypothetical protein
VSGRGTYACLIITACLFKLLACDQTEDSCWQAASSVVLLLLLHWRDCHNAKWQGTDVMVL